nr:hypothetical protein [Gemmatimonadales bacterium]
VYAYPARGRRFHDWLLQYSYSNLVGLDLILQPDRQARTGAVVFAVELRRIRGRWLVEAFDPSATFAPVDEPPRMAAQPDFAPGTGSVDPAEKPRIAAFWFVVLLVMLVALPLLLLAGILGRERLRQRRAAHQEASVP